LPQTARPFLLTLPALVLASEFLIEDAMATGALVPVLADWKPSPVEMTALWQRDRITGRLIKAIVGAFKEALCAKPTEV
jgi:DNA-binding transcriptional LysR family regulator